jgi:hypothetical protein
MNSIRAYIKILPISIGFILFSRCDKEIIDSFNKFPSDIGNKWIYDKTLIFIPYGPDSILQYNWADTFKFEILVEVDKTVMLDKLNIETLQFSSKETNLSDIIIKSYQYYTNNNYGLLVHAYSGGGTIVFAKKKNSIELKDLQTTINAEFMISEMFFPGSLKDSEDSLFYLENPSVSLKYPLKVGSKWYYVKNDYWEIQKSIIDIVDVRTPAGRFECYKIRLDYKKPTTMNEIDYFEYYGSKGLIKREINIDLVTINDANGQIIEHGKAIELYELKDYTIKD